MSGTGQANGSLVSVSGLESTQGSTAAVSGTGDANGGLLAISGTGDASGLIAVSGTGNASGPGAQIGCTTGPTDPDTITVTYQWCGGGSPIFATTFATLNPDGTIPVANEKPLCTMELRGHFIGTQSGGHVINGTWEYGASTTCTSPNGSTAPTPPFEYIEVSAKLSHQGEGVVSETPTNFCDDCYARATDPEFVSCTEGAGGGCSGEWFGTSQHVTYAPPGYTWQPSNDARCTVQLNGKELFCLLQGRTTNP